MLPKSGPSKPVPPQSDQERRLLEQLQRIDQHLRTRCDSRTNQPRMGGWAERGGGEEMRPKGWPPCSDSQTLPLPLGHLDYFSEIHNHEQEDDSLFDTHLHLLHPPTQPQQSVPASTNKNCAPQPTKQETQDQMQPSITTKTSPLVPHPPTQVQILKERNYIYQKETNNKTSNAQKPALPPKFVGKHQNHKSTASAEKGKGKKCNATGRLSDSPENKRLAGRQPYLPIYEQEEAVQAWSKFQTFEPHPHPQLQSSDPHSQSVHCRQSKSKHKCLKEESDKSSMQCTFKPTILKKSSQLAKNSNKNVIERLSSSVRALPDSKKPYQPPQGKQVPNRSRLEELSQPRKLKTQGPQAESEAPSFKPCLSKKSLEQMSNCIYDVATRNQLWLQQREEKIHRLKEEEEQERRKKENCTHAPSLCLYKGDQEPRLSQFGKEGIANYFERLSTASRPDKIPNKGTSRTRLEDYRGKENSKASINQNKDNYTSKTAKKQSYQEAVKQLHSRIMGLKI